jgi:hypothetical protein
MDRHQQTRIIWECLVAQVLLISRPTVLDDHVQGVIGVTPRKSPMKKRFPDKKMIYHLRDYAILGNQDGSHDYVSWAVDKKTKKLAWIRGKAVVIGDLLALTRITTEGEEERFADVKEVRRALKKLPDWWEKTKYYCVIVGQFATTPCRCTTGTPIDEKSEDFRKIQDGLRAHRVVLRVCDSDEKPRGIDRARAG